MLQIGASRRQGDPWLAIVIAAAVVLSASCLLMWWVAYRERVALSQTARKAVEELYGKEISTRRTLSGSGDPSPLGLRHLELQYGHVVSFQIEGVSLGPGHIALVPIRVRRSRADTIEAVWVLDERNGRYGFLVEIRDVLENGRWVHVPP